MCKIDRAQPRILRPKLVNRVPSYITLLADFKAELLHVQVVKGEYGKYLSSKLEGINACTETNDNSEKKALIIGFNLTP